MTDFSLDWYLVTTTPANEMRAKRNLDLLGITSWLPKYSKVTRQHNDQRFVERVLFPGYLFIAFERGREQWQAVRDTPGAYGVIAAEGRPVRVPNDDVAALMSCCLTGFFDQGQRRVGSKVRVVGGKHAGLMGRIVKAPDEDKATVMLHGFGSPIFQQVALDQLRIAA